MSSVIKTCLGAGLLATVTLWSGASTACQLELDSLYTITPIVDDGLSRAERVDCALGELRHYDEKQGWLTMVDERGRPLRARDMAGLLAPKGELLVVILEDNRIAMRWGGPGSGDFFANDAEHRAFYAFDPDGAWLKGLRIGDVSFDQNMDQLRIGMTTDNAEHCEVASDDQARIYWTWKCVDPKDASGPPDLQQVAASGMQVPALTKWECRNTDVEITCNEGGCDVSASHTPMDVTVDQDQMSICAYSGCWSGAPAAITLSGSFLTFTGVGLPFSTNPDDRKDVSITIETSSRVANILVAGQFANPATCQAK